MALRPYGELESRVRRLKLREFILREALSELLPYIEEDFPNGADGECCASDNYRKAYKKMLAALKGE